MVRAAKSMLLGGVGEEMAASDSPLMSEQTRRDAEGEGKGGQRLQRGPQESLGVPCCARE